MFTFTAGGRGRGVYTKLRLINEIKSYITYLISNSNAEIYFYSNIEIGHSLRNPHIHTQIWSDDKEAVRAIFDKVISKFELKANRCKLSEPQHLYNFYDYIIKDYSKKLSDNEVWNLEQTKMRMRKHLGKKLRFISKSKSKYTQKMYRMVYRSFCVLRAYADKFLDLVTSTLFFKREVIEDLIYSKKFVKSSFISIKNKSVLNCSEFPNSSFGLDILFFSPNNSPPVLFFCEL